MWFCGIGNLHSDDLTQYLAQVFAKTVREAQDKIAREAA
jgi:hypothetical protein